jgi:hypothetical protein
MRYVIFAVFFYCLFLFLRSLFKTLFKPKVKSTQGPQKSVPKSKKDLDSIEDADYEEIKK